MKKTGKKEAPSCKGVHWQFNPSSQKRGQVRKSDTQKPKPRLISIRKWNCNSIILKRALFYHNIANNRPVWKWKTVAWLDFKMVCSAATTSAARRCQFLAWFPSSLSCPCRLFTDTKQYPGVCGSQARTEHHAEAGLDIQMIVIMNRTLYIAARWAPFPPRLPWAHPTVLIPKCPHSKLC